MSHLQRLFFVITRSPALSHSRLLGDCFGKCNAHISYASRSDWESENVFTLNIHGIGSVRIRLLNCFLFFCCVAFVFLFLSGTDFRMLYNLSPQSNLVFVALFNRIDTCSVHLFAG